LLEFYKSSVNLLRPLKLLYHLEGLENGRPFSLSRDIK
jgi:hypothetical protein